MCNRDKACAIVMSLFFCSSMLFTGCNQKSEDVIEQVEKEEITIPVVFRVDPNTNVGDNQEFIAEFNAAYEGKYRIEVEWLTESRSGYRNKLKQWNVLDEMPVLITDAGFDSDFYQLMISDDRLVDLSPYMKESEFWMDYMHEDGNIYLSPSGKSIHTGAGIIYNEELLRQVGYTEFPQTWEEFFACLEALEQEGITPIALHGADSYWVPMLFATAYLQGSQEGRDFFNQSFPTSFQNDSMKEMLEILKKLYHYTFKDAVNIDYDTASVRFSNGEAAMIASGYWTFTALGTENSKKMRFSAFPGGVVMNDPRMDAWAITKGYSDEVTEAAVKVLEFRIKNEREEIESLKNTTKEESLLRSYMEEVEQAKIVMPNYQLQWEQEIQNEFFATYMPEFINGTITTEEFLLMMDEKLKEITYTK